MSNDSFANLFHNLPTNSKEESTMETPEITDTERLRQQLVEEARRLMAEAQAVAQAITSEAKPGETPEQLLAKQLLLMERLRKAEEFNKTLKDLFSMNPERIGEALGKIVAGLKELGSSTKAGISGAKSGFMTGYRKSVPAQEMETKAEKEDISALVKKMTPEQRAAFAEQLKARLDQ